jgi:AbrB family looped-hinge helix DNA binding protein
MAKRVRLVVQSQGRISLPKEIREALGIDEGSVLEVRVEGNKIIMEVLVK